MANRTLVIGNKNYSSWSLRPWLVLRKIGFEFEEQRIALFTEGFREQIAQQGNLGGKAGRVPVLLDGDLSIWDTLAICEYLAEQQPNLWPKDNYLRALARSMVAEMHSGFQAVRHELPMNCRAKQRQLEISSAALADIQRIEELWGLAFAQQKIPGPWLFGQFSIADAFFAPVALRFHGYQLELSPATQAYVRHWLEDEDLQSWIQAGQAEAEVIAEEEVGVEP